ncbi:MAG TPA: hypothetical protein VH054_10450, partial [Polyangiaceae bacterium]|nr:hypothetical protein [Polyangiaceae bacterium]
MAYRRGMCPPHAIVRVGSYASDAWGRCSACGAWVWSWELDAALAEAAIFGGDVRAAAKLLVEHDLPYGPV